MASKSKMSAAHHIVNWFFNGLAYSADQHMLSGVFGVEEFIFNISFMIRPHYGLQIKDGCRPPYCKLVFQWLVQTIAHPPQSHESPDPKMTPPKKYSDMFIHHVSYSCGGLHVNLGP